MKKEKQNVDLNNEKELASRYAKIYIQIKDYESKLSKLEQLKEEITNERYNELKKEYLDFINNSKPVLNDLDNLIAEKIKTLQKKESILENELNLLEEKLDQERKMYEAGAISKKEYDNRSKPLNLSKKSTISQKNKVFKRISTLRNAKEGNCKESKKTFFNKVRNASINNHLENESDGVPNFYKNPSIAAVLSFLYAGLGQIYNGEIWKGVIFIFIYTLSALSMLIFVGFITTPVLWIWGIIDAYSSASKVNEQM